MVATGSDAIASARTYGRLATTISHGPVLARRDEVGRREADPVPDPVPDGVLAGQVERVRRDVDRQQHDLVGLHPAPAQVRGDRDRDRAAPRPDVEHAQLVARRPHAHHEPPHDLLEHQVDQPLGLGSRDERPASTVNTSPWNSLMPRM